MKRIHLLLVNILVSVSIFSQVTSNCTAPPVLLSEYEYDVKDLALQRIFAINSPDTSQITIGSTYQDTIWHGLAAIFNASSIPARDSVFDIYCIHNDISSIYQTIYVGVDNQWGWTTAWANLNTTTGYVQLDSLLAHYGFTITDYLGLIDVATLTTNQSINIYSLIDNLETLNGIIYAEPAPYIGDGNRISYNKIGNDQFFDFSVGWGDCQAGCIFRYVWQFKVDYVNCTVDYLGAYGGQPLPSGVFCNITNQCTHQNISISTGWSIISSYIDPDDPDITNIFGNIDSLILLVKNSSGQTYIPSIGINSIVNWEVERGYQVKATDATFLTMGCDQVDPSVTPIFLAAGWNIIAYLRTTAMDASTALGSVISNILLVKNYSGQTYIPSIGINNIGNMLPGQGYKVKMSSADTLYYPGN